MKTGVKICGLNSLEAADAALKAGAEFGGLVFFPPSPRHVGLDAARALAARLRGGTRIVALMVDPDDSQIMEIMAAVAPDLVQLHGRETPARAAAIGRLAQRPVIKAIALAEAGDLARAAPYEDAVDYFLFDAKADIGATRPGGLGAAFDWHILSGARFKRSWGVAGGLTAENVARAIRIMAADFVDASSGVEDAPGRKSPVKIAQFVAAARNARYTDKDAPADAEPAR
jgi:phosphoribosylanthranilate isomerase